MQIFVVGMNHNSAPVTLREKFVFSGTALDQALESLRRKSGWYESLVLSTCNRTEIYGVSEISPTYVDGAAQALSEQKGVARTEFENHLYAWSGPDAVEHLFKVVCGLDSMVLGESEVLGQVKKAYERASAAKNTGKILHRLFQCSFHVAKAVRTSMGSAYPETSVSAVAVDLAKKIFSGLESCKAMIVGAGETGEQTVRHLMREGVRSIVASNRSFERAQQLAREFGGEAVGLDDALPKMAGVDIVISSTSAPHALFSKQDVQQLLSQRKNRPLFFIDIAVPRDIDPAVNELDNVFLYNIDDLRQISCEKAKQREQYIAQSRADIAKEMEKFFSWFAAIGVAPTIERLTDRWEEIRLAEFQKSMARLGALTPDQKEELEHLTRRILAQILHLPKQQLKRFANRKDGYYYTETLTDLFQLAGSEIEGHERDA